MGISWGRILLLLGVQLHEWEVLPVIHDEKEPT